MVQEVKCLLPEIPSTDIKARARHGNAYVCIITLASPGAVEAGGPLDCYYSASLANWWLRGLMRDPVSKIKMEPGKMVQWVRHLTTKLADTNSVLQTHMREEGK